MGFLHQSQAIDQLKAGRSIEHWLGHNDAANYRSIRWLRIDPESTGNFNVAVFEVFDDGNPEMLDIYSFEPVDPDLANGLITVFESAEQAVSGAIQVGASADKFVGAGVIQELYAAFLGEHGQAPKP